MRKENFIPLTETFLPGQRLMLIDDVFVPVGFGGNVTPGKTVVKDIGKGIYYKCTSVNSTAKKWAGNRAVQGENGIWTFEDKVTQNLDYTDITPEQGGIYSYNALLKVKLWEGYIIPTEGLVFYAPLSSASDTAETGQTLSVSGDVSYSSVNGIPSAYFNGSSYLYTNVEALPTGDRGRTMSVWCKCDFVQSYKYLMCYGLTDIDRYFAEGFINGNLGFVGWGNDHEVNNLYDLQRWVHFAVTYGSSLLRMYVNGVLDKEISMSLDTGYSDLFIGSRTTGVDSFCGYMAGCRIYNRILTQEEITALFNEFAPTA